jgi:hypothetical protein
MSAGTNGSGSAPRQDLGRIEQRLDSLEKAVGQNEKALKRALQMFAAYLDSGENTVTGRPS